MSPYEFYDKPLPDLIDDEAATRLPAADEMTWRLDTSGREALSRYGLPTMKQFMVRPDFRHDPDPRLSRPWSAHRIAYAFPRVVYAEHDTGEVWSIRDGEAANRVFDQAIEPTSNNLDPDQREFVNSSVAQYVHCAWLHYHVLKANEDEAPGVLVYTYSRLLSRIQQLDPRAAEPGTTWFKICDKSY